MGIQRKISADQRLHMIVEAAHLRAERQGFCGGDSAGARTEWRNDVEKIGELCDSWRDKVQELRAQTERAEQRVQRQAEAIWDEISRVLQRVSARASH